MPHGSYRIRDAVAGDLPAILSINAESVPGVSALAPPDAAVLLEEATIARVAEEDHDVIAYVIVFASSASYAGEEFQWFLRRPGTFLYVDQVAVARRARGRGVATALYADIEAAARGRGVFTITLEVNLRPENSASMRFHGRRGFVEAGRLETRDGRLVSLMEKTA
jgi:predicted GNAT superfamily acetyltransferase